MSDLALRARACPGWAWMPRMCVRMVGDKGTVTAVYPADADGPAAVFVCYDEETASYRHTEDVGDLLPDLEDPATLGCILALVRKAWGDPDLCIVSHRPGSWQCLSVKGGPTRSTEIEALVAALEAAPR